MNIWELNSFAMIIIMYAQSCANKELDQALRNALLAESNLDTLETIFYPTKKPSDAYVEIDIYYKVKNISSSFCNHNCSFSYDTFGEIYENRDVVAITSLNNNDQTLFFYVTNFIWIIKSVDITFYNLLSVFAVVNNYPNYVDYSEYIDRPQITLEIDYLSTNPSCKNLHDAVEKLFSWVRHTILHYIQNYWYV